MSSSLGKEPEVSSSELFVGVPDRAEKPCCNWSSSPVCTEEVVEDGRIEGSASSLGIVVIVGLNLWASTMMRFFYKDFNEQGVIFAELFKWLGRLSKGLCLHWGNEPVVLLNLVSFPVLLHHDVSCQVQQQVALEANQVLILIILTAAAWERLVHSSLVLSCLLVILECLVKLLCVGLRYLLQLGAVNLELFALIQSKANNALSAWFRSSVKGAS